MERFLTIGFLSKLALSKKNVEFANDEPVQEIPIFSPADVSKAKTHLRSFVNDKGSIFNKD